MKRKLKKALASLAAVSLLFCAGCGGGGGSSSVDSSGSTSYTRSGANFSSTYNPSDTGVVYW